MSTALPLEVGSEHELTIDNLAFGGDGVGRIEGVTAFVPDVCPGERVRARITSVQKRFVRAELLAVLAASPDRETPLCPLYGTCGGCQFQHLAYPAELAAKTEMVRETLRRVGHLTDPPVEPIAGCTVPYGYRNKVDFAVFPSDEDFDVPALGYHTRDGGLVEVANCPLLLPELNMLLDQTAAWLVATGWPPLDPDRGTGLVRGLGMRYSSTCREATVLLTTARREMDGKARQAAALRAETGKVVGLRHMARTRASQTAEGRPVGGLEGRQARFKVGGLSLRCAPESFFQVNDLQLEPLLAAVREAVDPQPADTLADLYGGVGTFGLPLASSVGKVVLIEVDRAAVHDAEANVKHNRLPNVSILCGQVEQQLADLSRATRLDKVILDPPRTGCSEAVLALTARARPRRVAYVSCDPATLARDLARFEALGYGLLRVRPFDLFPRTAHIECVATLAPSGGTAA